MYSLNQLLEIDRRDSWQEEISVAHMKAAIKVIKDLEEDNETLRNELKHQIDLYEEDWAEIMREQYGE